MNKNLVLQVWLSDDPLPPIVKLSIEQAVQYASNVGADYHLATTFDRDVPPNFGIVHAWELDYRKVFYLDCDAIVMPGCPDAFEFDEVAAVPDVDLRHNVKPEDFNSNVKERYGIPETHVYLNTGVMLLTRDFLAATKPYLEEYLPKHVPQKSQWDQSLINELVAKHWGRYHALTPDWNAWYAPRSAKFIQHYAAWQRDEFDDAQIRADIADLSEAPQSRVNAAATKEEWVRRFRRPAPRTPANLFRFVRKQPLVWTESSFD